VDRPSRARRRLLRMSSPSSSRLLTGLVRTAPSGVAGDRKHPMAPSERHGLSGHAGFASVAASMRARDDRSADDRGCRLPATTAG
jgi:hypothetical protein